MKKSTIHAGKHNSVVRPVKTPHLVRMKLVQGKHTLLPVGMCGHLEPFSVDITGLRFGILDP